MKLLPFISSEEKALFMVLGKTDSFTASLAHDDDDGVIVTVPAIASHEVLVAINK